MSQDFHREPVDLAAKMRDVPHKPGVYLMRDRLNRVIYVGKARDLSKRLASYFTPSRRTRGRTRTPGARGPWAVIRRRRRPPASCGAGHGSPGGRGPR